MAHGATRKIRCAARREGLDLRGLDKRQQRRAVRLRARSRWVYRIPTLPTDSYWLQRVPGDTIQRYRLGQAIGMPVLAPSPRIIVSDVS